MNTPLPMPIGGLSDLLPFGKYKPGTTQEIQNMWTVDPRTGRVGQLSQRSGQTKVSSTVLAASTRVHTLMECIYANPLSTYSNAASALVEWNGTARSFGDVLNVVADTDGNVFYLDGRNGIVKNNHDGVFQYRIALPSVLPGELVRSLAVDSAGLIFAGVSSGTDPKRARLWCFEEIEDNKTQMLWELQSGWYTEAISVTPAGLYCAQNNTDTWQSRMALYVGYAVPNPTLLREWPIAYPVNDFDVSPIDGNVATAHPPQVNRGATPQSPETTAVLRDKSLRDLDNFGRRAHTWLSCRDVDGDDTNNANRSDGEIISTLIDKTGNGRNAFEVATGKGFTLRKGVLAGQDVLSANGTDQAMKGLAGTSTDLLFRKNNKGLLPCHATHQSAVFLLVQVPQSNTRSVVLSQNFTTAANVKDRRLMVNASFFTTTFQNANGSAFLYEEVPAPGAWGRATGSGNTVPLGGAFDAGGLVLFTWIFDHGVDDVAGNVTRSTLRINGRPVDRWKSGTGYETLQAAGLMCDLFGAAASNFAAGNFLELFVISDWAESSGGIVTAQTRQKLITDQTYPDAVWGGAGGNTEVEWIEGVIMAGAGASHLLPSGHEATLEAVAVVNNNDTVTIDGRVYTFKTTLTGAADEVLRDGTTGTQSLRNLHHAINGTGARGTAYTTATAVHATVWSPGVVENDGTNQRAAMMTQAREARSNTAYSLSENTAEARLAWIPLAGAATVLSVRNRTASATEPGIYPHPYFLLRTTDSTGAPPSATGALSVANSIASAYGLMCLWDATNGKLKNSVTTAGAGTQTGGGSMIGLPFGGVGYGVRFLPDGNIISVGPRQALVSVLGTSADDVDIRKFVVTATGFTVVDGTTVNDAWEAAPGAWDYAYPRMAVDPFGNVYVPFSSAALAASMLVYKEIAPSVTLGSALILQVDNLTDDPKGRAVALSPIMPAFPSAYADKRAEIAFLATQAAATTNLALHALRLVTTAANNQPHTVTVRAAGVGAALRQVNDDGTHSLIDAAAFDVNTRFVDWCFAFGRVFITDGVTVPRMWDPAAGTFGFWRVRKGGQIPKRPLLLAEYRNRVFVGPLADERFTFMASASGDPFNWDFDPKGEAVRPLAAWHSRLSGTTGDFPDNVTCLCARENDILVVGGERSVWVLRGDPMQGGALDMIVKGVGVAFGRARTFTPDGTFWFISDQAELRRIMPDALASRALSTPPLVSRDISKRLSAAIDFSVCRPELHYDPKERRLHILLVKHVAANTSLLTHFTYEIETEAFTEVTYATNDLQPSSMLVVSGTAADKRTVWLGNHDGYVRKFDPSANGDDGTPIDARVIIPVVPNDAQGGEWSLDNLTVLMTQDSGAAIYTEFLTSDAPDSIGTPFLVADALVGPGMNTLSGRVSGNWVGMRVRGDGQTVQRISIIEARGRRDRASKHTRSRG